MTANGLRAESTKMIGTAEWALSRRLGALPAARAIDKAAADAKLASSASRPTGVGIARIKVALSGVDRCRQKGWGDAKQVPRGPYPGNQCSAGATSHVSDGAQVAEWSCTSSGERCQRKRSR